MTTFAKKSFDAVAYAASRPSYPAALYSHVLSYSAPSTPSQPRTVLDLGCGPALSTLAFVPHYDRIIGLDPSAGMINAAKDVLQDQVKSSTVDVRGKDVLFVQGSGENLQQVVESDSVDLVVAGQAAHWFNPSKVYNELRRVLKPGGAFVFWGYGEFFLPNQPSINKLIPQYSGGKLGPYWQQPGRSITEALLSPYPFPDPTDTHFDPSSFQRSFFLRSPTAEPPRNVNDPPSVKVEVSKDGLLLTHQWTLAEIEAYLRTFSSVVTYKEQHGGEDPVPDMIESLRKEGLNEQDRVEVAWEVGMIMGKKARQ